MTIADLDRPLTSEKRVSSDPENSYTLPARYYIDAAIFEREKEAIHYRSWQPVCHVSELSEIGSYATYSLLDQNIMVVRGGDSKLRAFYNVCSHRAHQLLQGSGTTSTIVCRYHAWSYHTDAACAPPAGVKTSPASTATCSA